MQSGVDLSKLLQLPDEAILRILANSLPEDINAVRRINQRLRRIATDNHLWKAKFQIHFPHLFNELNQIPDINWYAEFANAYRQEYTTAPEDKKATSFLPLRIRRLFSLIKEGHGSEFIRHFIFADLEYQDVNNKTIVDWAIKNNDQSTLDAIFKVILNEYTKDSEIDVKKINSSGYNILHWAVVCRQSDLVISMLLRRGVDANAVTSFGMTPLFKAIIVGCPSILKKLLHYGADINVRNVFGKPPNRFSLTPLIYAIIREKEDMVAILLERGADPNIAGQNDNKPLHVAVKSGQIEIVKLLLDGGADIDAVDKDGYTPLIMAALSGKADIAELLLARGAGINRSTNAYQVTALIYAALCGHKGVVDVLVRHNADRGLILAEDISYANNIYPWGYKAIHVAIKLGHLDIAKALLVDSVDVNMPGNSNNTPMMTAAIYGRTSLVAHLIDRGANINARSTSGATALAYAIIKRQDAIVDMLLEQKADVSLPVTGNFGNREDVEIVAGDTPLHIAARFGNEELVTKLLMANGAIIEARNSKGQTPADVARANSKTRDMLKLFQCHLKIIHLDEAQHKKSITLFGHEFNYGVSVIEQKAAVSELLKLYKSNQLDESILARHPDAFKSGELGSIARRILGK